MKIRDFWKASLLAASAVLAVAPVNGQQTRGIAAKKAASHSAYSLSREVSVQGTVVSYTENSATPPAGAHAVIQTSAGSTMDVFLGDARLLKRSNLTITKGSSIRVIGEAIPFGQGTVFVARLVQQGTQVAALRSTNGMPYVFTGNRGKASAQSSMQQGGPR
jgi:hypothetical protein